MPVCVEALVKNPPPGVDHDRENVKVILMFAVILISSSDLIVVGWKL